MRIAIDYISSIGTGGVSLYTRELVRALSDIDKENKYFLYCFIHDFLPGREREKIKSENFKSRPAYFSRLNFPIPRGFINFTNKISIRTLAKLDKIDIFHFTNPLNFIRGPYKSIVTVHDLSVLHNSQWAKKISLDFFKKNIESVLNKANKILTDAEFTKKDIIDNFNIPEEKIKPIHLGVGNAFHSEIDKNYLKKKFNLENYILYVGELQPRKNIAGLLEAYKRLDNNLRRKYNLVLVGRARDENFAKKISDLIKKLNLGSFVRHFEYAAESDLIKLYSNAEFLLYPSFFEGFGFPVLESISCGVPVITSNTSSLPEVIGQAGILVNPEDINQIKSAIEKLLLDKNLYQKLKKECLNQASKFNWQKTARQTLAVYGEVYKN